MLEAIGKRIRDMFTPTLSFNEYDSLEAYIVAGNPQNANDVDRLEQEFYRKQSNKTGAYNSFPLGGTHR